MAQGCWAGKLLSGPFEEQKPRTGGKEAAKQCGKMGLEGKGLIRRWGNRAEARQAEEPCCANLAVAGRGKSRKRCRKEEEVGKAWKIDKKGKKNEIPQSCNNT